jgi:hypothetical protein
MSTCDATLSLAAMPLIQAWLYLPNMSCSLFHTTSEWAG